MTITRVTYRRRGLCAVVVIIAASLGLGCSDPCGSTVRKIVPSPFGDRRAVVSVGSCGATTSFTGNLSIVARDDAVPDNNTGNTFRIRDSGRPGGASISATETILVHWTAEDRLAVEYDRNGRVLLRDTLVGGVHVTYIPVSK